MNVHACLHGLKIKAENHLRDAWLDNSLHHACRISECTAMTRNSVHQGARELGASDTMNDITDVR